MGWLLALVVAVAGAECPQDALQTTIEATRGIERAYSVLDDGGFDESRLALGLALPCVDVEITVDDAVAIHRARAIAAFVDGDASASGKSWAAVRALLPDWQPPPGIMPPGHGLYSVWERAVSSGEILEFELAPDGGWAVDGLRQRYVPRDRAFVLQGLDDAGAIVYTGYHYSLAEVPLTDVVDLELDRQRAFVLRRRVRLWGTVGAVALAGLAAGSFVLAVNNRELFVDPTSDPDELTTYQARANAFGVSGIALGVGAVGLGTVAWTVRW